MSHHTNLLTETISLRNSDEIGELNSRITTAETNISTAQTNIIVNGARGITNASNILFTDLIKFKINGAYVYTAGGGNSGISLSTTNPLTSTPRRYKLLREDTYDNDVVLSDDNTTFTPIDSGNYLSLISAEIYDNSADTKTIQLELIEIMGSSESSKQIVRHTFTGSSTSFEYAKVSDSQVVSLTAGKDYWYKASSSNGGVINAFSTTTNFTLIKLAKSF